MVISAHWTCWELDFSNENGVGPQGAYAVSPEGRREVTFVAEEGSRPRTCVSELPLAKPTTEINYPRKTQRILAGSGL